MLSMHLVVLWLSIVMGSSRGSRWYMRGWCGRWEKIEQWGWMIEARRKTKGDGRPFGASVHWYLGVHRRHRGTNSIWWGMQYWVCKGFPRIVQVPRRPAVFTVLGSNDAPLPDTILRPLKSGTVNDAIKTEVSPWYSNLAIKLCICFLGSLHISSNLFSTALAGAPHVPTCQWPNYRGQLLDWHYMKRYGSLWSQTLTSNHGRTHFSLKGLNKKL
jgi:hypothetical protein